MSTSQGGCELIHLKPFSSDGTEEVIWTHVLLLLAQDYS